MATDSTNLPQGETTLDAGMDMTANGLDLTTVQEVANEPQNFVDLPKGNTVILLPVQPGQTLKLPTDTADGVLAKIGPEGNLALVVDGRTIILQGFLKANDQSPVKIVTNDGDDVNVADLLAATDPSLDIQTAAGPASGDQGDTNGSGIYIPFLVGPGLGGILAEGILDPTALQYRLIDDEFKLFTREEDTGPSDINITFDILGGIINEDDLPADQNNFPDLQLALVVKDQGNDGTGNDPFDTKDREPGSANNPPDDADDVDDNGAGVDDDREPLVTVATVKVNFGPDVPGTLWLDKTELPDGLKSEGEEITYEVQAPGGGQGNGVVGFIDGNGNGKLDLGERVVFDIKVQEDQSNSVFHVNFTLYDNIDNTPPDADKDGAADLLGADEQILDLPVKVTAKDSDGSTLSTVMHLGVEDDIPFFGEVHVNEGQEGGIEISIEQRDADITHDETKGVDGDADDQSYWDAQPWVDSAKDKVLDSGFGLPNGDSEGALWPKGVAQTQVMASFGADQATQEYYTKPATEGRNSVFGELEDLSDRDGDNTADGENERPFELFMTVGAGAPGAVETHFKNPGDTTLQTAHLSIADQATNTTVTWDGQQPPLTVYLHQVDAQTIIGYVIPPEGDENSPQARLVDIDGENGEAVFVLTIDDQGVMTFVQYHQLNHPDAGDGSNGTHDEPFQILAADGSPLINVRISDYDGDHASQPVNLVVQDDGPKFCGVDWGCDGDSKNGKGLIDEDKLDPNGNHDWAYGDDKGGKHADGKINFDFGVDKPGHVEAQALTVTDSNHQTLLAVTFSYVADEFGNRTYTVDGDSDLKTADGHAIEIEASFDASTGLLTLIGRDSVDGSEAFTYSLQTTGYDKGEFSFCLNEALYHPYTDSDSQNDGPEKSFEDNLKFDLAVRGYDVDGDWAEGSVCINVDDDSPKAECDFDCVVEGKTDGELNTATGNVVTGNGDTIFGDDDNNLDGNQDHPGADQPYTISKLDHCGDCYLLVQDDGGNFHVEKNGVQLPEDGSGDANFDPATGILHIPTHEGGTLDIVLVSDVQSEVGDYKYTVPANAEHDHDIHAGPADLAESVSGAFNDAGDWTSSFASKGITIVPLNGNLDVKSIDVAGGGSPDYRGIGVESFEGDEIEVDRGGNEGLRLDLPNDTNNIALTIGALFDGAQYDNGHQEILQWTIYNNGIPVGSGQILGTNDGIVTLDVDSLLPFDRIELKPVNNGQGDSGDNSDFLLINAEICCPEDKFTEKFDYTLRDADGDESCATLKVDVKDTEPTHGDGQPIITKIVVDEDGLPNGVGNTDSPADDNEDHNAPNAPVDDAKHIGTIPFTPGADPVSIELSVFGGPETPLRTLDNKKVFAAWDSATQTLIGYIEGTDPNDAANQVFRMQITDAQTGAYEFELLQAVKHNNSDIFIDDNTENVLNLPADFIVVAEIEDKDCDVTYSKVIVSIDDDMPVITECHDEQGNDINLLVNGGFEDLGTEDGGTLDRGSWGVFSKLPGWTSGHESDSSAAGVEVQSAGAVGLTPHGGNNYVELDSDTLNPGDPAPSSTNASIYQDVDTVDGNNYVLSFSYSPRTGDESTDGVEVWFDGVKVATIDSGEVGKWSDYTFVVKAGEGDGTPDESRLEFKAVGTANSLGGFIDDVSLTACALVDEDALPNGIEGGPGDDGPIGACFSGSLGVNFGADGGKSIEFSESGQPSLASHGQPVKYFWNDATDTLIAYTGASSGKNNPANWVFTVEVESLDNGGEYKFTLLKPLDHPDSNDNHADDKTDNGTGAFEDNLVFELKFKATDRDDDTVTGHLKINVDDDSPKITDGSGSISLHTDETVGGGADVLPNPGTTAENDEVGAVIPGVISAQVASPAIGFSQGSATGLFNGQYGADGPGSPAWSLTITGGGATGLVDTATNTAITLVAGANGVVLGKAAGGEVVFAFSIDGSGNVTMVQYRAVNHGANEASPGDHDEAIFMNSGVLGVTLKLTDFDGDAVSYTRDISGSISIDDDGPHATCDYDSVTEGAGHIATGNVVSGANPENPDLGTDANGTDGNADQLSQDTPHTISKLTHGGHEYTLSADGLTVLKDGGALGAGESFAGGKLTITTEEGATFEIIMVSSDPADVGEYKYTTGPNPIHAEDVHVGPADLAATRSAAFDTAGEWQSAFSTGGINLVANGGSLAIKNVDVDPKTGFGGAEDYRGIGVDTGLDNAEVDTQSENLTLEFDAVKFPGGVNNAELLIGALFNGVQFDSGSQEVLKWEAYDGAVLIASGQIVGDLDGLVTLDIDTPVNFDKIVLTPLNNGAGNNGNNSDFLLVNVEVCEQEPVKEEFGYTLRDGDGDESSATLKICVEDTYPRPPEGSGTLAFGVDEDGLPAGIGNNDSPNDIPSNSASFAGNIPFIPGADPVTIELSIGNGGDTGLKTLSGQAILGAWDAATKTLIGYIAGTDPSDAGNQIFKMTVTDDATGAFDFQLLKPIQHANTDQGGDNTENLPDPQFEVNVQIEDKDCDVAFTKVTISIDDDMPVIGAGSGTIALAVDESLDGNTTKNDAGDDLPNPGTRIEDDEDGAGLPGVLTGLGSVIGASKASATGLFAANPGADGLLSAVYSLTIGGGGAGPVATNLVDTQDNTLISLFTNPDGTVRGISAGGHLVFAFTINAGTGEVSMAQYRAINHGAEEPAPGNHDEEKSLGGASASSTIPLLTNLLSVTLTVTDKDNDTVSKTVDITNKVTFDDDGPTACIDKKHDNEVIHDETPGLQDDDQPNASLPAVFTKTGLIGWAHSDDPIVTTSGSDYGTDGAGTTVLSLKIPGAGTNSGLDDTATGNDILLYQNGSIIEGKVAGSGELVFAVSINQDGTIDVAQYRAIEHPDDDNHDEDVGLNSSALQAVITITDKDGDSDTASVDIGSRVRFDDDGPKADIEIVRDACIILDESKDAAAGDGYPDGNANDEAGNVAGDIAYGTIAGKALIVDNSVFGTDGPGAKTYSLVVNNGTSSGLFDSETNASIKLYQVNATTIEGRPDVSGTDPVSFRITIDPATGNVTVSQFRAVEHDNAGSSTSDHDESGSPEIMDSGKLFVRQTITDGDKDHDSDDIDLGKIIKFEDDGPIARNDVDSLDPAAGNTFESKGNVITGAGVTTPGIDDGGTDTPWSISAVQGTGAPDTTFSSGKLEVNGNYGKLFIDASGNYTYDFNEANTGKVASGSTEVFTYTLRDSDGDTDPATLTIKMGEASVETSATVNPETGGCVPEDTYAPIALTATPGTPGDVVTQITLTNVPADWDVKGPFTTNVGSISGAPVFDPVTHSITFNITGAPANTAVTVNALIKGAPDSDVNGTGLTVGATVVDGVVFAKDTTDFNVIIDSVADGDDKGDDGDADKLGVTIEVTDGGDANSTFQVGETGNVKVTASYDDFVDGSETHTLTIQLAPGFTWTVGSVVPGGFTVLLAGTDSDTVVLQVDSSNGVGDIEVNLSVKYNGGVAGNESGVFSATVVATETPTDSECNPDNNTDSATATDTVGLASPPDSNVSIGAEGNTEAICVPEDSLGVDIPVTATTSAGSHLTQIVITGFPAGGGGFTINELGLNSANTSAVYDAVAGTLTITFLNDTTANFSGTFKVIPPADSDLDLGTLTATLTAVDNVDPALTDTDADQAFVRVDAIADGKGPGFGDDGDGAVLSVSLTASDSPADLDGVFAAGEKGQLTLGATFDDFNDGSELHQITITAPAGFQFTGTITGLPAGVTVNTSNASTIVLDVDSNGVDGVGTIANVQIEIQNVGAPDSVTLDFTAIASAVEQNTTATNGDGNDECTDGNNAQSVSTTAAVTSQTDKLPVAYDDKVCGDEAAPRNVNVLLILDRSGSMGDEIPGSGGKTRLELLQEATAAMLNALAENGDVRVMVVGFTTSASSNNQWVDVATAITLINALTPGNLTNYEDALDVGANAFNQDVADRGDFADHDNLVFFMSDGVPTTGGDSDNGNELTNDNKEAWDNFLENPGNSIDQLTVVGIGSDIAASDDDLEDVADPDYTPGDVDAKNPFGQVLIVADENDLKDALGGAIATAKIEGNVLDGSIENDDTSPNGAVDGDGSAPTPGDADNLGDTPTHISQFKYDAAVDNLLDITINYDGTGDVDLLDITGGKGVSIDGTKVSFDADYGRMTFDFSTGKFTFLADSIDGGDKEEHFNYTLKDTDGDVDSANLIVCIQDKYVDLQPIAYDNHDALTESSVSGAVTIVNDFNAGGTGGTLYGGSGQAGGEMVLTTSDGSGAEEYSSLRTSLIAEGLSGAALDALVGDLPDEGSAFVRPVSVAGPSVLRFEYDYNGNSDDNDVALYFVLNSSNQIVAQGVLGEGNPDVANGVVTVPLASAGNYKVIFTVNDRDDDSGSSTLDIDRIETQPATIHTVSGNVVLDPNDTPSGSSDPAGAVDVLGDGTNRVTLVQFGSTIVDVPSDGSNVIVTGANGILTINSTGAYTYTSLPGTVANGAVETDAFTYTLKDSDGDSDTAILRIDSNGVGGTVTISDVTVNEGGTANIVVTLSEPAPVGGLTLNYTFSGGTATSGDDYTAAAVGATVTVLAGATTANIVVNAKTDGVFDDNETYNVVLSGAPAGWTISDATGVVTIDDKTTVTAPVVTFTAQDPGTSGWPTSGGFTTNGSNTFNGDDNNNRLDGESGNDVIDGKGGHDQVQGGSGDDSLTGGSGNDFLEGEDNNDTLNGGTGNDLLSGDAGNDQANGGDDADDVNGDAGNDILHGNAGNDLVNGGDDSDQVFGDDGNDELFGGNGTDTLNGGNNSDYLHGDDDSSLDKLLGGDGDDWISVESNDLGAGRQIDGGAGNDVLDISGSDLTGSTGITGIEVINMEGGGNQDDVSLNASDVVAIAGGGTLFIWGDGSGGADDDVALTGGGWTQVGDNQSSNGRTYDVFQNGTTLVAVDTDVEVALS